MNNDATQSFVHDIMLFVWCIFFFSVSMFLSLNIVILFYKNIIQQILHLFYREKFKLIYVSKYCIYPADTLQINNNNKI